MDDAARITPRQIWAQPTTTTTQTYQSNCTPFLLPSDGLVHLNRSYTITLSENAIFEPICTGDPGTTGHASPVLDTGDPFYSSTTPQLYAIGCATVVSYLLVIILFITPRTFYVGGPGGGANILGRNGMSGSYSGNSSVVGVGGRPWLQKVAAILVAISLTIASADSFRVAEQQYDYNYSDATALETQVIDGMEIRIVRVISSTFLWLAQVQTLIRLFPRHKEKVMIKWAGFALIVLDTTFSILDNFLVKTRTTRPRLYDDAIPALDYLFELALNLLYAAWVIFYSISKHRFAFFHPKMRNICLVALLSLCAVLIPVVFFVLDIAKSDVAGWGNYIRWVGSAAASVVVWEWVERIEALEREERKDGILGREVFDGDEMLEVTPSEEIDWPRAPYNGPDRGGGTGASSGWGGMMGLTHRPLRTRVGLQRGNRNPHAPPNAAPVDSRHRYAVRPTPPPVAITPVSRADTTSAASTVYNVRYHPVSSPTPPVAMPHMEEEDEEAEEPKEFTVLSERHPSESANGELLAQQSREQSPQVINADHRWRSLFNPFRRRHASLPREVASAQAEEEQSSEGEVVDMLDEGSHEQDSNRPRGEGLFSFSRKRRPTSGRLGTDAPLPVTVIPARRRGQNAWLLQVSDNPGLLEPSLRHQSHPDRPGLPVRVIPSQTATAAPWTTPDGGTDHGDVYYELRYDPDAAALVGPDDYHSGPLRTNSAQHSAIVHRVSEDAFEGPEGQPTPEMLPQRQSPAGRQSTQPGTTGERTPGPQDSSA